MERHDGASALISSGNQTELFYEDRFIEQYVGRKLVTDPIVAVVELVANCWDAGATDVNLRWPNGGDRRLEISDNGEGMTKDEFIRRWGGMSYDRSRYQDTTVEVSLSDQKYTRQVFGRNGIGRFAAFCFGLRYKVITSKNGEENSFLISKGHRSPLNIKPLGTTESDQNGTSVIVDEVTGAVLTAETIREEIARRFLTDPSFHVTVNNIQVSFADVADEGFEIINAYIPELKQNVVIREIDAKRTDQTGKQHGVAWHVLGRLVGDCGWRDPEQQSLIDGRRVEAKRFTFIVEADHLHDAGAVTPDWSGFDEENVAFRATNSIVQEIITKRLLDVTREKRAETTLKVRNAFEPETRRMSPLSREKWRHFVDRITEECPRLTQQELESVSGILAKMESAETHYGLLHKLDELSANQIDDLHNLLDDWTLDMVKVVLDEIKTRLQLIEKLRQKTSDDDTLEVQELQPLFRQGLWIFGPEFETIHYTSNEGMTSLIQKLFAPGNITGSRNRPDFAVLPDSTVGLYSYPDFNDEGTEIGIAKLVIVELKAPRVRVGDDEKNQCWKYIRELIDNGVLGDRTKVDAFVLGRYLNQVDREVRTERDGRVRIQPLDYTTILQRADSRLFKLRDQIKNAPFLQQADLSEYLD